MEKALLSLKEVCEYTGWGQTKTRKLLKENEGGFAIRVGNRLYVHKEKFDEYLNRCAKYGIDI
nr:MAG TPA: excisionase [Caudoviricetes sp.]